MRLVPVILATVALVAGGCTQDESEPLTTPQPGPTEPSYEPPPQDPAAALVAGAAASDSSQPGAAGAEDEYDALLAKAQQRNFAADSISRQLQAAQPANADWSALDASYIEDFVAELCMGDPEAAAQTLMREGVQNADLRAAPGLTQALLLSSQECNPDNASLDLASNVMNQYLVAGQQQTDFTARQLAAATPPAPNFLETLLGGICRGTIRKLSVKSGAGFLFGVTAGVSFCPGIIDELLSF